MLGVALGIAWLVSVVARHDEYSSGAFIFTVVVTAVPAGVLAAGVVLGTAREYARGRHAGEP